MRKDKGAFAAASSVALSAVLTSALCLPVPALADDVAQAADDAPASAVPAKDTAVSSGEVDGLPAEAGFDSVAEAGSDSAAADLSADAPADASENAPIAAADDSADGVSADAAQARTGEGAAALQAADGAAAVAAGLAVTKDGSAVSADANGVWRLSDGSYKISGTANPGESVVVSGDVTLTLDGASIEHGASASTTEEILACMPAVSIESGSANIVLQGQNSLKGSAGKAGVYVAQGASLVVSGDGSLAAQGGNGGSGSSAYWGGGAGIGGNGDRLGDGNDVLDTSFGSISIQGGNVNATGGNAHSSNDGGGAGIGAGGACGDADFHQTNELSGSITIDGGTVTATGGDTVAGETLCGGAGIGAGGFGGAWFTVGNQIQVSINNGDVRAYGKADGAGIGGGSNADGGSVSITGGNVLAVGGWQGDNRSFAGAGIGGGDNAIFTNIEISGGTVVARAQGCAAGIGSGADGDASCGSIIIKGNADVSAFGGSNLSKQRGGAAIGSGWANYTKRGFKDISIGDTATVRAYAGYGAQAVGFGSISSRNTPNTDAANNLVVSGTPAIWALNNSTSQAAVYGADTATIDGLDLVSFVSADGSLPAEGAVTDIASKSGASFSWKYALAGKLELSDAAGVVGSVDIPQDYALGNWAAYVPSRAASEKNVTIDFGDGSTPTVDSVAAGSTISRPANPVRAGYRFAGWYVEGTDTAFDFSAPVNSDVSIFAKWIRVFNVNFDNGSGAASTSVVDEGAAVSAPADPVRDGYKFLGWFAAGSDTPYDFASPLESDLSLEAHWEKVSQPTNPGGNKPSVKPGDNEPGSDNGKDDGKDDEKGDKPSNDGDKGDKGDAADNGKPSGTGESAGVEMNNPDAPRDVAGAQSSRLAQTGDFSALALFAAGAGIAAAAALIALMRRRRA